MTIPLITEVNVGRSEFKIDYQTPVLMIGSCFSDNIGMLLEQHKFIVSTNPFGVLYNPLSIAESLKLAINNVHIGKEDLIFHNNLWHSFSFHGSFSHPDYNDVIQKTNSTIQQTNLFLAKANYLIVTFGTSWVYEYKKTETIVSNCHKIPEKNFNRYKLSVETISKEWISLISHLQSLNPNLKIIFTISPIRHLRDGAHENQLSKSTLFLAIEKIRSDFSSNQLQYFPSYEIMMDELRDYRFYASDMIHLSDVAIEYIYEKFTASFFSQHTINCIKEVHKIMQAKEHRLLTGNKDEIKKFAESYLLKIDDIEKKHPNIKFPLEKHYFKNLSELQ